MRVGIIQSSFLPWRGYFDFIDDVDLFVFLDDVQYTRRDWRNRNRFKVAQGTTWVTVPVRYVERGQSIENVMVDNDQLWIDKSLRLLEHSYGRTPYFGRYIEPLREIMERGHQMLSELNVELIRWLMNELDIMTETRMSREFAPEGVKTERLLSILKKAGASHYLSGPSARDYLDERAFREADIGLSYKSYDYPEYPQPFPPFEGQVSVLDLLFNCGPESPHYLKSRLSNEIVIP